MWSIVHDRVDVVWFSQSVDPFLFRKLVLQANKKIGVLQGVEISVDAQKLILKWCLSEGRSLLELILANIFAH